MQRYIDELPNRFLHFSSDPAQVTKSFLPKADRNLNGKHTAVIYRAGVFVREIEETEDESIYDYNFKAGELQIDECRNASDYAVKAAVARLYRKASTAELVPVFSALVEHKPAFEAALDQDYILPVVGDAQGRAEEELAAGVAGRGRRRRALRPLDHDCRVRREEGP